MAEKKALLILRLEGALQSWGEMSKWDFRDSADFPSKSGIVGLLGCAMGIERESSELAALSDAMTVAVRADRPGIRFTDFQTVTGGPLRTAEGKRRRINGKPSDTFISNRVYIQDACFTVFIEVEKAWRDRIVSGLMEPKWCMYLGRKNCVPSRPVLECADPDYDGLEDALRNYPAADRAEYPMQYETEREEPSLSSFTRSDSVREGYRSFSNRRVWRGIIKEGAYVPVAD